MSRGKESPSDLLGELERLGYLVREPDPDDRRSKRIVLTNRGVSADAVAFAQDSCTADTTWQPIHWADLYGD